MLKNITYEIINKLYIKLYNLVKSEWNYIIKESVREQQTLFISK